MLHLSSENVSNVMKMELNGFKLFGLKNYLKKNAIFLNMMTLAMIKQLQQIGCLAVLMNFQHWILHPQLVLQQFLEQNTLQQDVMSPT